MRIADVKRLVEERHGAIDVLKTWWFRYLTGVILAITGFGWVEVTRFVGNMRRSPAFR